MMMAVKFVVGVALLALFVSATPSGHRVKATRDLHPDVGLNALELIQRYGYPVEQHTVTTSDGYILEMHRIPHGINNANETGKPAVLLQHGLLSSSADWVNNGARDKSLAFILADRGYDVWMGNFRGNTWSRKHVSLDADSDAKEFWNFSWNEIGKYDLPAKIDYITAFTGQESIFYIGHSQGTTSFFVMASEHPEYNAKIKLMSALAPIAYMSHMKNLFFQLIADFEGVIDWMSSMIGLYEFLPHSDLMTLIGGLACADEAAFQDVCSNILFLIAGYDSKELNETLIPVYTTNIPAGSATKQMVHYAQGINSGKFRQFDYGLLENIVHYGEATPPAYRLAEISAPIALYYSANDLLAAIEDVDQLYNELPHVVLKYKVTLDAFNHLDYMWAIDVPDLVYGRMIDLMDTLNTQ